MLNYFGCIAWLLIVQIRHQDSCAVRLHQSLTSLWRKRGFLRLESHVLPSLLLMHLDAWWWQILTLSLTLYISLDLHVNHMRLRCHRWVVFFLDSHLGSILILHWLSGPSQEHILRLSFRIIQIEILLLILLRSTLNGACHRRHNPLRSYLLVLEICGA